LVGESVSTWIHAARGVTVGAMLRPPAASMRVGEDEDR
jgi:hypothetical protein